MMGVTPAEAALAAVNAGADIVGANCGKGYEGMTQIIQEIKSVLADIPVIIQANAGLPELINGVSVFPATPDEMAAQNKSWIKAGVNIIGGCCGTTDRHIHAIRLAVNDLKEITDLLQNIRGVVKISRIESNSRKKIIELEEDYEKSSVIGLQNTGIRMIMQCTEVFAILKDSDFRPPPGSTVFLVEELKEDASKEYLLSVDGRNYRIIGEELINKKPPEGEDYMYISEDFVIYPERRKNRAGKPAFFLIPPLGFNELESVRDSLQIRDIISVSPSTMSDKYIREQYGFPPDTKLATILIGFNRD